MVEEFGGPNVDAIDVGAVIDACTTPPFLVERRVVVLRQAGPAHRGRCQAAGGVPEGSPSHDGAGAGGRRRRHSPGAGHVRSGRAAWWTPRWGSGRARSQWLADHLTGRPRPARGPGRRATWPSTSGRTSAASRACSTPWPPPTGPGPPSRSTTSSRSSGRPGHWPRGTSPMPSTPATRPRRSTCCSGCSLAGESHPLVVMAILHRHYRQMLRLDGAGATTPDEAAGLLGLRSAVPGQEGPVPVAPAGIGPDRPGHPACWPRPTSICGA